ncbi:MAG: hypothetical protein Q7K54_02280 [Candidatus Parcubacteria bacterium]|nr:hypothetical protein [Candidatus Parcubacteria bacterium]
MNFDQEHLIAIAIFVVGTIGLIVLNIAYANIFKTAAKTDAGESARQASITFVSGHFLAFFILPFAIIVAATLGILGKLDSGISAIIGMIISYVIQKVTIR